MTDQLSPAIATMALGGGVDVAEENPPGGRRASRRNAGVNPSGQELLDEFLRNEPCWKATCKCKGTEKKKRKAEGNLTKRSDTDVSVYSEIRVVPIQPEIPDNISSGSMEVDVKDFDTIRAVFWQVVHEFMPSDDDIIKKLYCKWNTKKAMYKDDLGEGKLSIRLYCNRMHDCDCNARLNIQYYTTCDAIAVKWYNMASSHGVVDEDQPYFLTYESHEEHIHNLLPDKRKPNAVEFPEDIEKFVIDQVITKPSSSPGDVMEKVRREFASFESKYGVGSFALLLKKVTSKVNYVKKKLKESNNLINAESIAKSIT